MTVSVSILGLYTYNPNIFSELTLPNGLSKDILTPLLLSECSDFTLVYPDADYMQYMIGVWGAKNAAIWAAMQKSVNIEYNPIENYDRHESITRTVESEDNRTSSRTSSATSSSESSRDETDIDSRTAFNSNTPQEAGRTKRDASIDASDSSTETASGSDSGSSEGIETVESHIHGNIGVTTAQQMITGYREVSNFSVYEFIIASFKNEFCIQVY